MDWEHSFRKRWTIESVGSVPRKRTYRCDKTIDLEDLIAEENRKAANYFDKLPKQKQDAVVAHIIKHIDRVSGEKRELYERALGVIDSEYLRDLTDA